MRAIRRDNNLTQSYMAGQLNITQEFYGRIENGKRRMTTARLLAICQIMGVELKELSQHNTPPNRK